MTDIAFDGLLFDKDGTLIDFDKTWTEIIFTFARIAAKNDEHKAHELLAQSGYDFANKRFAGGGLLATGNAYDMTSLWYPDLSPSEIEEKMVEQGKIASKMVGHHLTAIDGVDKTLRLLKNAGFKLGMATNDSEKSAKQNIQQLGWNNLFDVVLGFDSVENPKPAGDQVQLFAKHCALKSNKIAMIGDNLIDMAAAHAGGAFAIGVLSGNSERKQLETVADVILPSVNALPAWLQISSASK